MLCLASGVRTRQTTTETMVSCKGIYSTSLAGMGGGEMKGEMEGDGEREIWCYQHETLLSLSLMHIRNTYRSQLRFLVLYIQ